MLVRRGSQTYDVLDQEAHELLLVFELSLDLQKPVYEFGSDGHDIYGLSYN